MSRLSLALPRPCNSVRYTPRIINTVGTSRSTSVRYLSSENSNATPSRESEWLFGTPAGRRQLQDSAKFGRLVVAVLRRGHRFESLEAVKEELTHSAKMLIPYGFTGQVRNKEMKDKFQG